MHDTPAYVKRNSMIGAALAVPFFLVVASGLTHNEGRALSGWSSFVAGLCLIGMPAVAVVLNAGSYVTWFSAPAQRSKSVLGRFADVRHTWPMLLAAGVSALLLAVVLFHDSTHCLAGNPVRELHNPHQTWQCITSGFLGGN